MAKTPLEKYILKAYGQREKQAKTWAELEKFGTKLPSGGHMWTGGDLIRYFEVQKKKKKRKKRKPKSKYKYYTKVSAQRGTYTVKHKTKAAQRSYEKKLATHKPYFRKVGSGKL